jgi:amino acid adenylation domain-containing protein
MNQVIDVTAEGWLDSLADVAELRLPVLSGANTTGTCVVQLPVSQEQVQQIRKIAGDKDLNVFKLFMGGLGILLWRYAAQNELVISMSPMLLPGVDADTSGTWHCKLNLQADVEVRNFFSQVHEAISDAYENADYDEAELSSYETLKTVGFHYDRLNAQGSWLDAHQLVFEFAEGERPALSCTSRNAMYPEKMLLNMLESLLMLVLEFPQNKEKPLGACNIVPTSQLHSSEGNTRDYPKDVTVVDLFLRHATQAPAKAAIIFDDKEVTYRQLDELSAGIAAYVINNAPQRKDLLIGIMMERTPMLVAAVIGILRAGAAYVPIDKNYPNDRIQDILHDAACPLVFTDEVMDDERFININTIPSGNAQRLPAVNDLAYIIYSSGTTGKPKGIMMEHGAIMNLLFWYNERYNINEETRIVQLTNIVIDIAFQEIFSALINGLTLYIPLKQESQDKQAFIDYLNRHRINFIQLIPDMLSEYLAAIPKLPHLLQILCGGDKLSDSLKDVIASKGYGLYNIYGQTETAIDTVGAVCRAGEPMHFNEFVPHYDVLIMDEYGNVCPEFLAGEIYTGGDGLARGYLNQPQLTAQKFIEHPLKPGQRIYRTGDIARRLPDGSLELMGRKDDQVKIRGFRVELAEVENALRNHPLVDAAVVLALQKEQDKQLVAYMVCDANLSAATVRAYLSQTLPAYMLPAHFVQLDKLPLTPSGKVDRRKLPDPEGIGMETGAPYVAPQNELEAGMAKIWQELLGKERIGIKDGFFESGGDSIKVLRLMSELKKELNVHISFADIYQHNTIENIVAHLQENKDHIEQKNKRAGEKEALVREQINGLKERVLASEQTIDKENIEDVYPMSDIEKGIIYESMLREGSGIYHDLAVHERIFPDFDNDRFTRTLELLMEKHSILRTSFNLSDYETEIQLVHKKLPVPARYKDLAGLQRQEQEDHIRAFIADELRDPFKFTVAPLWRICVFNCGNGQVVFVTQSHHSIMDGWSDASFMTELNNVYLKLGQDALYQPEPLKSSYKDFIVQHEIDKTDDAIRQFWQQELTGYARPDLFSEDDITKFACSLDAGFIQKLEKAALDAGASVKIISLSAYLLLLKVLNYGNDVVTGLVTNTRPDCEDSDKLIGCFLNTIPLRISMPANATGSELTSQVNNKLIELKNNERLSMLEISLLHNKQLQHGNPFFDVIFNYVDFHAYNAMQDAGATQVSTNSNLGGNGVTNTYLDLDVNRTGGECTICFRFTKKLRAGISPEKLADLYTNILSAFIHSPATNVAEWPCISEAVELVGKKDEQVTAGSYRVASGEPVEYISPRNEVEQKLVAIWQQLLDTERIGVKDHFFDLGGHSLKITRLASQVHKTFEAKIALKDLFMRPVLEEQAAFIQRSRKTAYSQIIPVPVQPHYPLSAAQRRLWVLCQFEQGSIAYNMPSVCIFQGKLDRQALEDAFNIVIDRHESLRTVFKEDEEGEIRQFINAPGLNRFVITFQDMRNKRNQQELLAEALQTAFGTPFNLVTGPLLRATICQLEENKWIFAYVMHHIIGDGWSMNVLMNELLVLYDVKLKKQANPLPPLKIQYRDFTAWQHEQLHGPHAQDHKAYWLHQFSGELPLLALPGDKIRPPVKTYNGGIVHKTINARLTKAIKTVSQQQGATLFMGLLGTVNTLLHKYTNQEDIIIGTPIAGREHADLDDQIGFYINTLPLRTRFKREEGFTGLLARIKEVTLGAYEHQLYPLDELVNELDLQRDMSRSALFDVMVVLQNTDAVSALPPQDFDGLQVRPYPEADSRSSTFDLIFTFTETNGEIKTTIEYNSDIYFGETIERMANHLEQLLQQITDAPATPIEKLDYLSDAEKHQLLVEFAGVVQEYPKDKTLLYLFEEQVQKTPSAPALLFEEISVSYQELNETANALGDYLRRNYSIRPNDFVGIQLDRSQWLVIAILGVLKSGGAYVPIDPAYPQDRIDYIIEDSSCKVVIDNGVLGAFLEHKHEYGTQNLSVVNKADDLAYIIYTSGSTGRPKGVMIEHRNAVAFIHWSIAEFAQSKWDVLFAATSICFDLSVYEMFYPLSIGKKVRVLNNALSIPQYLYAHENILLNTVPGAVGALLNEQIDWRNVSVLNMAGEPVPAHYTSELDCKRIEVRNLYGPSEDTTYSTYYRMHSDAPVLVGKPISNTQVYILDNKYELVPVGVTGEICIAGDGLARGYLNQRSLTAEKFVPNPFKPGARMYKTGDLGRWRPDGNIEFLGRKDDQVKIRGFRIELGEIETALRNHPQVDAAVVIARSLNGGEKELVAYITGAEQLSIPALRSYLGKQLPAYMVPGHFVQLEALPVTPNGKVDKKKLPDPQQQEPSVNDGCIAPRTEKQRKLLALLEEVLGKKNISLHDNFFDLGGHSLKAMKLLGILNKQHGFNLKIQDIYNHPTIEELFFGSASGSGMIRLNRYHSEAAGNIYFIPPILGNAGLYKPLADKLVKRYNCYGFQYSGLETDEPLHASIEQAAKKFSEELINHHVKGEVIIFGYSMGAAIAFEMAKLLEANDIHLALVLLDRGIPSRFQKLMDRMSARRAVKQFVELYKQFIPADKIDEPALKRFLSNNINILNKYNQTGKIKSRIYAFEADANNQRMKQWNNHTTAGVAHSFVKGGHWNALDENNLQHIAKTLENIIDHNKS